MKEETDFSLKSLGQQVWDINIKQWGNIDCIDTEGTHIIDVKFPGKTDRSYTKTGYYNNRNDRPSIYLPSDMSKSLDPSLNDTVYNLTGDKSHMKKVCIDEIIADNLPIMTREDKSDKINWDLLYPRNIPLDKQLLYETAKHMSAGAKVHGARNWENATLEQLPSFRESYRRHSEAYLNGETDENHHTAMMFNLLGMRLIQVKYNCNVFGEINEA